MRHIVDQYNTLYGTSVSYERAYERGDHWKAPHDLAIERIHSIQLSEGYGNIKPFNDAVVIVSELAKHHTLHLVTARDRKLLGITVAMVERYFRNCFASLNHLGVDGDKGDVCRKLNADLLVDDNLRHLRRALDSGIERCVWFGDYPWNPKHESHDNLYVAGNWREVKDVINGIA